MDSEDLLFLMYTSGTTAKPKGIAHTTAGYLVGVAATHALVFDLEARAGRVLVRGRHRLDHRPQLHRLRAALQRRDVRAVRGHAGLPGQGALVGDRRALRRHDPLHGADRDPRAHEVGAGARGASTISRRCGCSGSVGEPINPEAWMWYREHIGGDRCPDRRHVVADRDGDDHDHAAAGRDDDEARLGDEAVPGRRGGGVFNEAGERGRPGWRRLPRAEAAVAGDDARDLRRRRALPRDVLVEVSRASTSPATARGSTRTATSGCSAASTT